MDDHLNGEPVKDIKIPGEGMVESIYHLEEIPQVSKSQNMNELYAAGQLVIEDRMSPENFKIQLTSEMLRFYEIYKHFLEVYNQAKFPDYINEQAKKVFRSMEKYEKALDEINGFFENSDKEIINTGIANAIVAINELTEAYQLFLDKQSPSTTKYCNDCGHPNPLGTLKCLSCKSIFFLPGEELPLEYFSVKERGKDLTFSLGAAPFPESLIDAYYNYARLARGEITKEKYLEDVDWLITQLELSRQKLERKHYSESPETLQSAELLFDGIDKGKKALEKLRDKIVWDSQEELLQDWNKLLIAIHDILESQTVLQSQNT